MPRLLPGVIGALLANGGAGPFLPNSLSGLVGWYRFNQGITVATGVSQWNDASGLAHHLTQPTAGAQPAKQGDGSILFDGVAQFLAVGPFVLIQPTTVYILGKQISWTIGDVIADGFVGGSTLAQATATPQVAINAGSAVANNSNWVLGTYAPIVWEFNGASSLVQVSSNAPTTGNAGTNTMGGLSIGVDQTGVTNFANIQVKEVILYSTAHDASTRAKVITYLNSL